MITYTANEAKNKLGEVIDAALQSPVSITRHSRRSVVVMSDAEYQKLTSTRYSALQEAVLAGFEHLDRGESSSRTVGEIFEEVIKRKKKEAEA